MEPRGRSLGSSLLVPSVQELVKEPLSEVPSRYVRTDQEPMVTSCLPSELPVIDMERLLSHGSADYELERLHHACKDWGFFQPEDVEGFGQAFVVSEEQKLDWADMFFVVTLPRDIRKPHLFPNLPLSFRFIIS
ncbi:hypothetical protein E3N88_29675 [Mikania micrantha]|uniref:Non-haem dioxygenase N-terminal domain-containing protein n=1 Tax=Mikania micrantha TaxID=192012 RepID=A0A5N6MK84_9ASTR|nr:hypothetical protein E3N88_29675 [Mikania micrantha]